MEETIKIGGREFERKGHTYVMGILNITPDSFSDGNLYMDKEQAKKHIEKMVEEGVDIIDVGGESTRPGYEKVSIAEETNRLAEIIAWIKKEFSVPVSVDTYKSPVAYAALQAGADMVNDIWGLRYETMTESEAEYDAIKKVGTMAEVIKKFQVPICVMHNRHKAEYHSFFEDVEEDLRESLSIAKGAGIQKNHIILDPGIGFGKTYEMNLKMLNHLDIIKKFGLPVLVGASRKSVIGLTLSLPVQEREEGTIVTTVFAVKSGCQFVRVHDVKKNIRAIKMTEAILKS